MSIFSKHLFAALMGVALLSSCSRPVAYFQPSHAERFTSSNSQTVIAEPVAADQSAVAESPVATETSAPVVNQTEQIAQAKQAVSQIEAYVRNDNKLASNRKLTRRLEKVNEVLAEASTKTVAPKEGMATRKMNLMQRVMLKKLDRQIRNHVAPEKTNAMTRNLRLGIILAIIGLVFSLIFSGILGILGVIALVIGVVLIVIELVNQA